MAAINSIVESFLSFLADERHLSTNTLSAYRNDLRQFGAYLGSDLARQLGSVDNGQPAAGSSLPMRAHKLAHRDPLEQAQGLECDRILGANRHAVAGFFLNLRERSLAPATIARKMAAVKSLYLFLYRQGAIVANPAAQLGSPEVKKPLPRAISVQDIGILIRQATSRSSPEGVRDVAMLHVLCATGVRVTELVSLDIDDVDLELGRIRCTGRSGRQRHLPIGTEVIDVLRVYLTEARPRLRRSEIHPEAAFLNHRGHRLTRQGFWLIMKALTRDSGLTTGVTPHTLRHSFAAQRLRDGLDLDQLRELLGHANISTTQIYTQISVESGAAVEAAHRGDAVGASS